ncbi:MAG: YgjP-like metallopeptidase domain-containing protein [Pseudomonadota bacterium]
MRVDKYQEFDQLDEDDPPVKLQINPKAQRLILRIDQRTHQAVVVAPHESLASEAFAFARARRRWIREKLDALPTRSPFVDGAVAPLRGAPCLLTSEGRGTRPTFEPGQPSTLRLPGAPETFAERAVRFFKSEAKADLAAAVARHCARLGADARRITVKDTRSRWGSCTSDGRLAFSWRVIMAPPFVLDYLAAHECAHLIEMNHSPVFWKLVADCIGDPMAGRKWLREHGPSLHAYGAG